MQKEGYTADKTAFTMWRLTVTHDRDPVHSHPQS